jgi:hypothetical protein
MNSADDDDDDEDDDDDDDDDESADGGEVLVTAVAMASSCDLVGGRATEIRYVEDCRATVNASAPPPDDRRRATATLVMPHFMVFVFVYLVMRVTHDGTNITNRFRVVERYRPR